MHPSNSLLRLIASCILCLILLVCYSGCDADSANTSDISSSGNVSEAGSLEATPSVETNSSTQRIIGPLATAFYESSPAQGRPPDGEVPSDTIVDLVEEAGSYSLVKWGDRTGWVASDALQPITESEQQ